MAAPKGNQYAKGSVNNGRPLIYDDERIEEEAAALLEWIKVDSDAKLYIGSFARERGYDRARLSEFARANNVFARAYALAKMWQEEKFIRNGLNRSWDAGFTSKVMARVCGDEWKNSWDKDTANENIAALATAVMNYATAQPQDKGWQKPEEKPKKK
jgi:hypothetical protein